MNSRETSAGMPLQKPSAASITTSLARLAGLLPLQPANTTSRFPLKIGPLAAIIAAVAAHHGYTKDKLMKQIFS